jgi:hypothetical protein
VAISQKLPPSDKWDGSRGSGVIEALNAIYPLLDNAATFRPGRPSIGGLCVANGMLLFGVQIRIGYRDDCNLGALRRHKPSPFTAASEPIPNGPYAKRLLGLLERFRMLNLLTFTKQAGCSCFRLEFANRQRATSERTIEKICYGGRGKNRRHYQCSRAAE